MTTEQNKNETSNQAPIQKELELDLDTMEPITPKRHAPKPSLFEKVKNIFSELNKKNTDDTTSYTPNEKVATSVEAVVDNQNTATETQAQQTTSEEPTKTTQKNSTVLKILPKYHRIFIVLLIIVIILLIASWLKPSNDIVQSFEQPKSVSIPTQFQPLDQSQPAKPHLLDQLNNHQEVKNNQGNNSSVGIKTEMEDSVASSTLNQPAQEPVNHSNTPTNNQPITIESKKVENTIQPVTKTVTATMPQKSSAVEKSRSIEKAETIKKIKVETEKKHIPVIDAKTANNATASQKSTASKTLVIPQGISLMQVFRNNNLNIADVNAMTKAKGANNALNSFKPGDKIQISLNNQGRVNELRLSNGARFIRQTDGSYQFKK